MGWLYYYETPGAYNRAVVSGRDAAFVYNHAVNPGLLVYLAQASGVARPLVAAAKKIERRRDTMMARSGEIRRLIPWRIVHAALQASDYLSKRVRV